MCITDFTPSLLFHYAFGTEVIGYTVQGTVDNLCVYIQIIHLKGDVYIVAQSHSLTVRLRHQISLVRYCIKIKSLRITLKGKDLCT
jgi:hypothetical protein